MAVLAVLGLFVGAAQAVEHREIWIADVVPIFANDHHAGMRLHVAIDGGQVTEAVFLVPMESPQPVVERIDVKQLSIRDGRLHGTLNYKRPRFRQSELVLDVKFDAGLAKDGDKGIWTANADGRERKGLVRVAPTLRPADLSDEGMDLWLYGMPFEGIEDKQGIPPVLISVTPQGARMASAVLEGAGEDRGDIGRLGATFGPGYVRASKIREFTVVERKLTATSLTLRLKEGRAGQEIRIEGQRLGRLIIATAERGDGDGKRRGSVVGQTGLANDPVLYDYAQAYTAPMATPLPGPAKAAESFPIDEKLAKRALEETAITLPHGRPDPWSGCTTT
jgi:hypothetical protein